MESNKCLWVGGRLLFVFVRRLLLVEKKTFFGVLSGDQQGTSFTRLRKTPFTHFKKTSFGVSSGD